MVFCMPSRRRVACWKRFCIANLLPEDMLFRTALTVSVQTTSSTRSTLWEGNTVDHSRGFMVAHPVRQASKEALMPPLSLSRILDSQSSGRSPLESVHPSNCRLISFSKWAAVTSHFSAASGFPFSTSELKEIEDKPEKTLSSCPKSMSFGDVLAATCMRLTSSTKYRRGNDSRIPPRMSLHRPVSFESSSCSLWHSSRVLYLQHP